MMTSLIARLRVALQLDSAAFEKGSKRAAAEVDALGSRAEKAGYRIGVMAKSFYTMGTALAGSELVSRLKDVIEQSIEATKAIQNQARVANAGAAEFQRAAFAAKSVGIESEKLADIYKDVNDKVGEFIATGGGEMKDFFNQVAPKVGVTAEMFKKLSGPEALQLYYNTLEKAGLSQQQMTFYMEALADEATAMIPLLRNNGAEMQRFAKAADAAGIVMDEAMIRKTVEASQKFEGLKTVIQGKVTVAVTNHIDQIVKLAEAFGKLVDEVGYTLDKLDELGNSPAIKRLTAFFNSPVGRWATGQTKDLPDDLNISKLAAVHRGTSAIPLKSGGSPTTVWRSMTTLQRGNAASNGLSGMAAAFAFLPLPAVFDRLAQSAQQAEAPVIRATKSMTKEVRELAEAGQDLMDRLFPDEANLRLYRSDLKTIDDLLSKKLISTDRAAEARRRLALDGKEEAGPLSFLRDEDEPKFDHLFESLRDMSIRVTESGVRIKTTNTAIARSFKDMADDTIAALNQVAGAVRGGGFLNILSSVIGLGMQLGGIGLFGKSIAARINAPIPARAMGGPVTAGRVHLVGERGPELFVPGASGGIVPNHKLGGGGNTYHFSGNLMTPEFWAMIRAGDMNAARAGAVGGAARVRQSGQWRLG